MSKIRKFFRLIAPPPLAPEADVVEIHSHRMPIHYKRHARARNYVLRLHANRSVVVTLPRFGTRKFARDFVASRKTWLEKQWRVLEARKVPPQLLRPGMSILFRGCEVPLEVRCIEKSWELCFGGERVALSEPDGNLRPVAEKHLLTLAGVELTRRVEELAREHQATVSRVVVRNQKSRWGSCSYGGSISLNWRLIQVPDHVRDYIILHELMHLRELNHSPKFWVEVEGVCPNYRHAENWLRDNSAQVGF